VGCFCGGGFDSLTSLKYAKIQQNSPKRVKNLPKPPNQNSVKTAKIWRNLPNQSKMNTIQKTHQPFRKTLFYWAQGLLTAFIGVAVFPFWFIFSLLFNVIGVVVYLLDEYFSHYKSLFDSLAIKYGRKKQKRDFID
jgi:hypothetical protein